MRASVRQRALALLPALRREHHVSSDTFLSCGVVKRELPSYADDYAQWLLDPERDDYFDCSCGANDHNARVDELERLLKGGRR